MHVFVFKGDILKPQKLGFKIPRTLNIRELETVSQSLAQKNSVNLQNGAALIRSWFKCC